MGCKASKTSEPKAAPTQETNQAEQTANAGYAPMVAVQSKGGPDQDFAMEAGPAEDTTSNTAQLMVPQLGPTQGEANPRSSWAFDPEAIGHKLCEDETNLKDTEVYAKRVKEFEELEARFQNPFLFAWMFGFFGWVTTPVTFCLTKYAGSPWCAYSFVAAKWCFSTWVQTTQAEAWRENGFDKLPQSMDKVRRAAEPAFKAIWRPDQRSMGYAAVPTQSVTQSAPENKFVEALKTMAAGGGKLLKSVEMVDPDMDVMAAATAAQLLTDQQALEFQSSWEDAATTLVAAFRKHCSVSSVCDKNAGTIRKLIHGVTDLGLPGLMMYSVCILLLLQVVFYVFKYATLLKQYHWHDKHWHQYFLTLQKMEAQPDSHSSNEVSSARTEAFFYGEDSVGGKIDRCIAYPTLMENAGLMWLADVISPGDVRNVLTLSLRLLEPVTSAWLQTSLLGLTIENASSSSQVTVSVCTSLITMGSLCYKFGKPQSPQAAIASLSYSGTLTQGGQISSAIMQCLLNNLGTAACVAMLAAIAVRFAGVWWCPSHLVQLSEMACWEQ